MGNSGAIKAGRAVVEAYLENAPFMRGLSQMDRSMRVWGGRLTSLGAIATGAGAAIVAPLAGAVSKFVSLGGEMADISARTGISAGALSELDFAAKQTGASLADIESGSRKLAKFLSDAKGGSKEAVSGLAELGISLEELQNLSPDQAMILIGKRIAEIKDPAERAAKMMQFFGKSGTQLLPMMQNIDALARRARELGLVLKDEDVEAADAFGDKMDELWAVLQNGMFIVGGALVPALDSLVTMLVQAVVQTVQFVNENRGLVTLLASVGVGLVAVGAAAVGLGSLLSMAGSVIGMIGGAISGIVTIAAGAGGALVTSIGGALAFLVSPIGLTVAAIAALAAGVLYFSGLGSQLMSGLGTAFESIKSGAVSAFETIKEDGATAFEGIKGALAEGNFGLAFQILWDTIQLEWQRGVNLLQSVWNNFKTWFLTIGMGAFTGAAQLFNNAWSGVEVVFEESVNFLQGIWESFTGFLARTWNSTIGFIQKAWVRMKSVFTDIDVEAEIKKIDAQTTDKNETSKKSQQQVAQERQDRQKQRRDQIERDRQGANNELQRQMEESVSAMTEANAAALREAEEKLAAAREKFKQSTDAGKAAGERAAAEAQKKIPPAANSDSPELQNTASKVSVASTFDASIASRLGAGSGMAERTAKATERTAQAAEKTEEELAELNQKLNKPVTLVYA